MDNELTIYKGPFLEFKIDVDNWSYFELVGIIKKFRCREIYIIWYNDPSFEMHVLADDKDVLDTADLSKMHLSVDVYLQHLLSQLKFYDDPLEKEKLNHEAF